jgi:uncharacterized protein YpmS|tara:strand:- start:15207 stop:15419 length:213 start_codon:yes stop_codon:yes gene_type:complete
MEKMTTISTTYARVAIILLALNFVFTGYAITKLAAVGEDTTKPKETKATTSSETLKEGKTEQEASEEDAE